VGISPELIRVIPNGVDASKFLKLEIQTIAFVQELDLLAAGPLLLLPVRITRRKNIELALRVLAALRQEFPRAVLVVTGPLGPHNPANREYFTRLTTLRSELGLEGSVFCTDIPPLRALGGEFAAYFSPDSSPEEVARLIAGCLSKDRVFGLKRRVREHYTWEEVYQGHIEPLLRMLASRMLAGGST
jgi:glycosyltransferase involved in cell wall biosynthesis